MNCQQSHELFPDYLGKEITKEQSTQLAAHLKTCATCREELISLSGVPTLLRKGWPDEEIPRSLIFETPRPSWRQFIDAFSPRYWSQGVVVCAVATICFILCISTLALLKTELEFKEGHFRVSFNRFSSSISPQTETSRRLVAVPAALSRSDLEKLIENALSQSEQRQNSKVEKLLLDAKTEINANRTEDMQKVSQGLKYLEMTQGEVWKASARNASYLESLAREFYVKASSTN
jgi:hypothetical protein